MQKCPLVLQESFDPAIRHSLWIRVCPNFNFVVLEGGCEIKWLALVCEGCSVLEELWRSQPAMVRWQKNRRPVTSHESQPDDPATSLQDIIFATQITTASYAPVSVRRQLRHKQRSDQWNHQMLCFETLQDSVSHSQDFVFSVNIFCLWICKKRLSFVLEETEKPCVAMVSALA